PFMSNFGPAPSRMTAKISPSVEPRSHFASVRSGGWVSFGAMGPLPFASFPWQKRQFFVYVAFPAAIDSGVGFTGFFIFAASEPPGAAVIEASAITSPGITRNETRRISGSAPWEGKARRLYSRRAEPLAAGRRRNADEPRAGLALRVERVRAAARARVRVDA